MEGGLDGGDGGLLGGVVDFGEASAQEAASGLRGLLGAGGDCITLVVGGGGSDAGGGQEQVDAGVRRAVAVIFAGDGEVERVAVKCLAVDLERVGGEHMDDLLSVRK